MMKEQAPKEDPRRSLQTEFISVGALPRGFLPATISTSRTPTNVCIGRVVLAVDKSMQGDWKGDGWNSGVPSPVTETLEVDAPAMKPKY